MRGILTSMTKYSHSNERYRAYSRKVRATTLEMLGGKCVRCGFSDSRALQIDHINGGGTKDIRSSSGSYSKKVQKSFAEDEGMYQLLCANCNWIKRSENNEVR